VKELEIRLAHWERESTNYSLQVNLGKRVRLRLLKKEERNTIMKISGRKIKQVNRFTHLRSVVEKNSEIQNETHERIRKASKFNHFIEYIMEQTHRQKV
jgi:hypothetical protein